VQAKNLSSGQTVAEMGGNKSTRWCLGALGFALLVVASLVPLDGRAQAAVSLKYYYPVVPPDR